MCIIQMSSWYLFLHLHSSIMSYKTEINLLASYSHDNKEEESKECKEKVVKKEEKEAEIKRRRMG